MSATGWDDDLPNQSGNYVHMKEWKSGEPHRLRFLSAPIRFWLGFNAARKPVRKIENAFAKDEIAVDKYGNLATFCKAAFVWDHAERRVKVWEIRQGTILRAIHDLAKNPDWGDPQGYDLDIIRKDGQPVEYTVQPIPPKRVPEEAALAWAEMCAKGCDLNALLVGGDPFAGGPPTDADPVPF